MNTKTEPYWVWGCPYCGSARTTMSCCGESSMHFCWLGLDGENVYREEMPDDPRDAQPDTETDPPVDNNGEAYLERGNRSLFRKGN